MRHTTILAFAIAIAICAPALCMEGPGTADELDVRVSSGAELTFADLFRSGGAGVPFMLVLSVATVAAAIYGAIETRRSAVVSDLAHNEAMSMLKVGNRTGAAQAVAKRASLYGKAARLAIEADPRDRLDVARSSAERDAAVVGTRLRLMPGLAALSILAGMLATLGSLIKSFGAAAHEEFHYGLVYAGVMRSLVATFLGVGVAIVGLTAFFVIRMRFDRALADASFMLGEVVRGAGGDGSDA